MFAFVCDFSLLSSSCVSTSRDVLQNLFCEAKNKPLHKLQGSASRLVVVLYTFRRRTYLRRPGEAKNYRVEAGFA